MGPAYSPQVVAQQQEAARERLGQQEAQAYRSGANDVNKLGYARDVTVAGMGQPQLVQRSTSGTQQGTTTQSDPWGTASNVIRTGASVAPVSL